MRERACYLSTHSPASTKPEAKEASNWTGKGSHELGLSGVVEKEQFKALLEGQLPTGQQLGRMENGKIEHLPGYDLTFSAPKSVSILALVGGDKRIIQAHKKAVQTDLNYLEKRLAQTRIIHDGKIERQNTGNFVIAQFHHDTSRELDPQLHTHNVILNMTQRADGQWRSITGDVLYDHKMLNGLIYRAALAEKLTALGYELEVDHQQGTFEIKGIPQELIKTFSTRREQIEKDLETKGLEGAKASEISTLTTRVAKRDVDREQLKVQWQQQCKEAGFEPHAFNVQSSTFDVKENSSNVERRTLNLERLPEHAQQALNFSLNHLSEREAAFAEQDILKEALKAGMGKTTFPHIQYAFEKAKANGTLIEAGNERFTTPLALATEKSIIDQMLAGKNAVASMDGSRSFQSFLTAPFSKQPTVEQFLQDKSLTTGQKAAAEMILTTQDRIVGIQGYAGTGKTHMLKVVREYAEQQGFQVIGLSPKASAAKELEQASGIKSQTLSSFLAETEKRLNTNHEPQTPSHVFILDESSMASNHQLDTFFSALQKIDARAVLIGDIQQLGAIEAGKPFDQLQKAGMRVVVMQDILRQKNEKLLSAVYDSIKGDIKQALQKLEGNITETASKSDRLKALAETYLKLSPAERDNTLVLAPANVDRVELNKLIREGLKQQNQVIGNEATTGILINKGLTRAQRSDVKYYEAGDVIRANRQHSVPSFGKDEYYTVNHVDPKTNTLTLNDKAGNTLLWQPSKGGSKAGSIEVYQKEQRELMTGDAIRWTRNDKTQSLRNSETAQVKYIQDTKAILQLENNKTLTIDLNDKANQHWDHGYASTVHAAQGKTCDRVLVHADSTNKHLTHQRSFYVELSRAKHEAHFFTDNKAQLLKTIEKYTGEKTSAMELTNQFAISASKEQLVLKGLEM